MHTRKQLRRRKSSVPDILRAERLVMQLMAIAGPSGREARVAEFIRRELRRAGAPDSAIRQDNAHRRSPLGGEIGNLVLRLPGTSRYPRRMLSAHLDTVPICVGAKPRKRGHLVRSTAAGTGLGADNRAGCAVLLNTAIEVLRSKEMHPPLTFCWFVQEEVGLQGSRSATRSLWGRPPLAFNWDGGGPEKLTVGATGGCRMSIEIHGVASHAGGAPERGVSAIAIAAIAIANLHQHGWHGDIRRRGGEGTSNVGVIEGGTATNVVADRVTVRAEARSHDPQFRGEIVRRIEEAFQQAAGQVRSIDGQTGNIRIESRVDYESFLLDADAECVRLAEAAVRAIGREPLRAVANGGVDANWITSHGIPAVTLGCGQRYQHTVSELLDLVEFRDACRIAWLLATGAVD